MGPGSPVPEQLEALLRAAHAGDRAAEEQLLAWVGQRFQALARRLLGREHDPLYSSSDVLQEMCLRLLKRLRQPEEPIVSVAHFLGLAGQHLRWAALALLRRPRLGHLESQGSPSQGSVWQPAASSGTTPEQREAWERFHELVGQEGLLSAAEQQVLLLRWYLGLHEAEMAQVLGVSVRTLRRYWQGVKEKLRKYLDLSLLR
jgi:RNA polymerase sigma factor (sigma-70 family)